MDKSAQFDRWRIDVHVSVKLSATLSQKQICMGLNDKYGAATILMGRERSSRACAHDQHYSDQASPQPNPLARYWHAGVCGNGTGIFRCLIWTGMEGPDSDDKSSSPVMQ